MKTFDISSNMVIFNNCLLNEVIEVLDGQYAISKRSADPAGRAAPSGRASQTQAQTALMREQYPFENVEVKIVQPKPLE